MSGSEVEGALTKRYPTDLVLTLLRCYEEQKRNWYLGNLRPNEVEGGRFAEAAFRLLEHSAGLVVTPLGASLDTDGLIRRLQNAPRGSVPDSVRLHIPRALRVIYDIRNARDAAHLADGIDANVQDSELVSSCLDWVLAEFVRLSAGVPPAKAAALVQGIVCRRVPAVQEFGRLLKTLRPNLGVSDRVLLVLYHRGSEGATRQELLSWVKPKQKPNLARCLQYLAHEKDQIVLMNNQYQITRLGMRHVENNGLIDLK